MVLHRSILAATTFLALGCNAFTTPPSTQSLNTFSPSSPIYMAATAEDQKSKLVKKDAGYVPKWKKIATLADSEDGEPADKEITGTVPITFQQGKGKKATLIQTTAMPGQPLKLVASQAGQYIKYGCGKGECGTCESKCNGKTIRPCIDIVPTDLEADPETGKFEPLVIMVKGTRAKVVSSGQFFSVKSFFLGFWNNLLGMGGLVRDRRKAKKNWQARMDNEDAIKALTEAKKKKRAEEAANQ